MIHITGSRFREALSMEWTRRISLSGSAGKRKVER